MKSGQWRIERRPIFIKKDNARTHVECGDKDFQEAASRDGYDIQLMCQAPNSPNLNILDLGFSMPFNHSSIKNAEKH